MYEQFSGPLYVIHFEMIFNFIRNYDYLDNYNLLDFSMNNISELDPTTIHDYGNEGFETREHQSGVEFGPTD